jgi:hypothetical protein
VSAGIGSQKGVLRFLGEEQALAVKDANPRRFRKVQIRQVERSRLSPVQGFRRGWHDFSIARGCVPLLTLAGQADAQTLGGIYEVPPRFSADSRSFACKHQVKLTDI